MLYGVNIITASKLTLCSLPAGAYYFLIIPIYSGIISIAFVCKYTFFKIKMYKIGIFSVAYTLSLILFSRRVVYKNKISQAQTNEQMSKVQIKIFISVSITLFCYCIFYVIPTILISMNKVDIIFKNRITHKNLMIMCKKRLFTLFLNSNLKQCHKMLLISGFN